ncbi:oligosaccharide flippase family protein [Luminiphilus sp.]|nr:oligosaccharide flippase family protein [Luminiphilus sp.]
MKDSSKGRLKKNMLALSVVQISNYVLPLLILPFLTRTLGLDGFALISIVLAAIQLSFVITDYGLSVYAPYQISSMKSSTDKINRFVSNIYGLKVGLSFVALCIFTAIMWPQDIANWWGIFICSSLAILFQAYQPIWLFHGLEKMNGVAITSLTTKLCYISLVFIFVSDSSDGLMVIASWAVAQVLASVVSNWLLLREGYRISVPSYHEMMLISRICREYFISRLAVSLFSSVNTVVLGAVGSSSQVALYAICDQLYKAGKNATMPISQALYPYMTHQKNWALFYKILFFVTLGLGFGCSAVAFVSVDLITTIFGESFIAAAPTLNVFLVVIVINFISVLFGYPAFGALGRPDFANKTVIFGAGCHLVSLTLCIGFFRLDSITTAYITLCTELIIMSLRVTKLQQLKKQEGKPV